MDWETYYTVKPGWSLWIERVGSQWQLYFQTKGGGNRFIGTAATPQLCARMMSPGGQFPEGWIKVA